MAVVAGSATSSPYGSGTSSGVSVPATLDGSAATTDVPLTIINGKTASGLVIRVSGTAPSGVVLQNASSVRSGFFGHAVAANEWTTGSAAVDTVIGNDLGGIYIRASGSQGTKLRSPNGNGRASFDDSTGTAVSYGSTSLTFDTQNMTLSGGNPFTIGMGTNIATSGTKFGLAITATFAPTSGNADWKHFNGTYTINQAGGANGTVTGLFINATETAVVGTHNLIDLQIASASKFKVGNDGKVSSGLASIALGGGASATLGTIGGSGPTVAAQNKWAKMSFGGTDYLIPVWV